MDICLHYGNSHDIVCFEWTIFNMKVYPGKRAGGFEADMMAANELNAHAFLQVTDILFIYIIFLAYQCWWWLDYARSWRKTISFQSLQAFCLFFLFIWTFCRAVQRISARILSYLLVGLKQTLGSRLSTIFSILMFYGLSNVFALWYRRVLVLPA